MLWEELADRLALVATASVTLLAILSTVGSPVCCGDDTYFARTDMSNLQTAIDNFRLSQGRLPVTLWELEHVAEGAEEPFIADIREDPWENEYRYRPCGGAGYEITCAGEDGEWDTEDDLGAGRDADSGATPP